MERGPMLTAAETNEIASDFQKTLESDMRRMQDMQHHAAADTVKYLIWASGGLSAGMATWLQACLAANASPRQEFLVPAILVAFLFAGIGVLLSLLLPYTDNRQAGEAVQFSEALAMRMIRSSQTDKDQWKQKASAHEARMAHLGNLWRCLVMGAVASIVAAVLVMVGAAAFAFFTVANS
jgi:hypothetical protein